MITIEYSPEGVAVADHKAEEFVKNLVDKNWNMYETEGLADAKVSTENVITIARVLKMRDDIDVQFKFKDEILVLNKDGRLVGAWPDGFCNFWDKCLTELL